MTKFEKPGRREDFDYPDMAKEAVENALNDAKLKYTDIQQVFQISLSSLSSHPLGHNMLHDCYHAHPQRMISHYFQ